MSRVGGGGYAESRGGFGDRTGGGMSGNARDGRDGMGNRGGSDRFSGAQFSQPRRTAVQSPAYDATLGNLAKLASRSIPGAGMVLGAGLDIAGLRPGFTGYQGQVSTPGSYDPTNRAFQSPDQSMQQPGYAQLQAPGLLGAPRPPAAPQQMIQGQDQIGKYLSTPGLLAYGANTPGYRYF